METDMTTPEREEKCSRKTCCTIQYGEDAGVCMLDNCPCHSPKEEVQESREGDSWEKEGGELFNLITQAQGAVEIEEFRDTRIALMDWIRTKRNMWCEDAADVAFTNGSSIARTLALQEAASVVRGMKEGRSMHQQMALGDAAREIEGLSDKK